MADLIAIIDNSPTVTATVVDPNLTLSSSNLANPAVLQSMSDIGNVDTTLLEDGSVLVYQTITNKWTSTRLLNKQNVEAGEF